jgi:hypothetical protein
MNILLNITDVSLDKIHFSEKKTNMIMNGFFTKIMFSNNYVTMHGLYIDLPIKNPMVNKVYSRNVLQLDIYNNKDIIQKLIDVENQLLQYYCLFYRVNDQDELLNDIKHTPINDLSTAYGSDIFQQNKYEKRANKSKSFSYNLKSQLQNGTIKYYKDGDLYTSKPPSPPQFYIKISGIWENQYEIGITFKIIEYCK